MDLKPRFCLKCNNLGTITTTRNEGDTTSQKERIPCDCYWGEQWKSDYASRVHLRDRKRHLEDNPFLEMTDEEIRQIINRAADKHRGIDSEPDT